MYDNPAEEFDHRCKDADTMLALAEVIAKDYGMENFSDGRVKRAPFNN